MSDDSLLPTVTVSEVVDTTPKPVEGHYDLLSIKDKDEPKSIVNLVPTWLSEAISCIPDEAIDMTYESLRKQAKPTGVEEKLRHSFWNEYKRIIHDPRNPKISVNNVIGGVCSLNSLKKIAYSSYKLAYILQPPPSVDLAFDELIHRGLNEMMTIMAIPLEDHNGKLDMKLANLKNKILNDVISRRNGGVAQRLDIRSQTQTFNQHQVNHVTPPQPSDTAKIIDVIQPATPYQLSASEIEAAIAAEDTSNE